MRCNTCQQKETSRDPKEGSSEQQGWSTQGRQGSLVLQLSTLLSWIATGIQKDRREAAGYHVARLSYMELPTVGPSRCHTPVSHIRETVPSERSRSLNTPAPGRWFRRSPALPPSALGILKATLGHILQVWT